VQRAKILLLSSAGMSNVKKVYEVSEMVGYKDPKYFSQLFKKYTGFTPSEFKCKTVED
jgi:two-component system response regulator YesN